MKKPLNTVVVYDTKAAASLIGISYQHLRSLLRKAEGSTCKEIRGLTFQRIGTFWVAHKTGIHDVVIITGE